MLSDKYILSLIKKYADTPTGKKKIAEHQKGVFRAEYAKGNTSSKSIKEMSQIGQDMRDILFEKISKVVKSFRIEDIIVDPPVYSEGKYTISISFNKEALHRDSLAPERFPEGISNIIKLFVNGYDARAGVLGVWKGHGDEEIWSIRHRDPNSFMSDAVDEFNKKYTNIARAELGDEYKTNI